METPYDEEEYLYKEEVDESCPLSAYINPNLIQEIPEQYTGKEGDNSEKRNR
jgi:hypothetical protein